MTEKEVILKLRDVRRISLFNVTRQGMFGIVSQCVDSGARTPVFKSELCSLLTMNS